jgi:hypothetical protein
VAGQRLSSTLLLILKFAIVPRQLPDDDIGTATHIKGAFKKYGIANFEFVVGHNAPSLDRIARWPNCNTPNNSISRPELALASSQSGLEFERLAWG